VRAGKDVHRSPARERRSKSFFEKGKRLLLPRTRSEARRLQEVACDGMRMRDAQAKET